jgi:competence protein ComEC
VGLCAFALAGAAIGAALRSLVCTALALAIGAGALVAAVTVVRERTCEHRIATSASAHVVLDDAGAPGAFIRARADCGISLALTVERGRAPAGSTVLARGTPSSTSRGLMLSQVRIVTERAPSWMATWRSRSTLAVDRTFPADAPLARALLVADTRDLSPEIRDRYAAAGLAHMLSISGLHVGVIALALDVLFQIMRLSRRSAVIASFTLVGGYVLMIGAPAAAVRSAVMLGAAALSRLLQRPTSPWALLAIGATGPIFAPRMVLDIGFQLSVGGVAALVAAGALNRRVLPPTLRGWRRTTAAALIASTVATAVSAPLVAWTFGRVSLVGPLTNLVASPLMGIAQPMLFLGLIASPVPPLARLVGDAVHPLLAAFNAIATIGASVPGGWMEVAPTALGAGCAAVASACLLVACVSRHPGPPLVAAATAIAILVWRPLTPTGSGMTELHMIDVGQGDALALRTPHGHWVLFDAGRAWRGGDAGRATIVPYLARLGGPLEAFVLSHPHTDHVGGAATVLGALRPRRYVDAAFAGGADAYRASLERARGLSVAWQRAHPGDSLVMDGVAIHFLAPDSAWTASLTDPNLASTVALVQAGRVRFLLVGDAEEPEENWLLDHGPEQLRADVLKVGHHGSATSSSGAFLDAVRPRIALVSVGQGNAYGHPSADVLQALSARGAQVLRTDRAGTVVIRTDGMHLFVSAAGETWELPARSEP